MNNNHTNKAQKINEFKTLHQKLLSLINQSPKDRINDILFDKWSLHDVLVHLTAWNNINLFHTECIRDRKPFAWIADVDAFNHKEVTKHKNIPFEKIYQEFNQSGEKLIELFENLPDTTWKKKAISHEATPERFLDCVIDHYKNEHIPQIENVLKTLHS